MELPVVAYCIAPQRRSSPEMGCTVFLLLLWLVDLVGGVSQTPRSAIPDSVSSEAWQFLGSYPRQYIVNRLQPSEYIKIDGRLDDAAWGAVNWTEPMEDIAQSFYPGLTIPDAYATLMKVRYDEDFLYIGAQYFQVSPSLPASLPPTRRPLSAALTACVACAVVATIIL